MGAETPGLMKTWKQMWNQSIRRKPITEDIGDNKYYKKMNDIWDSPLDGKGYYNDPRIRRK
jgi:hypothetical protein